MFARFVIHYLLCVTLLWCVFLPGRLSALTLEVSGWGPASGINLNAKTPSWLGDDPILGRLACPALVRLEGDHLRNGALLLKSTPIVERTSIGDKWLLSLRPGLKWWTGTSVDADALAVWLREALPNIVSERLGIHLSQPPIVSVVSMSSVSVQWHGPQRFGPYVMSGYSFDRLRDGMVECVGLYAVQSVPEGVDLVLNSGYKAVYSKIHLRPKSVPGLQADHRLGFLLAAQVAPATSTTLASPSCQSKMDIPLVTAILWNPHSPMASSSPLRRGLTMATPRGDILRTAAGDLGTLVSAPLLRMHPGYNPKNLVRPFNLVAAGELFEQSGLKQLHIGLPRAKMADKGVSLRIARGSGRQELLEKIIGDAYASAGIETQFDDMAGSSVNFDGVLASVFIPWTSHDIRQLLHRPFHFVDGSDKSLADAADAYAYSLTHERPDFTLLRKAHDKWVEIEPWTVLMAHQYCVLGQGIKVPPRLNTLDPDWFRRLTVD